MFAHERSLVRKYEGRPFVLLGVNEDSSLKQLRDAEKKHDLNWRSWWDTDGLIASHWKLEGLPSLYLIDAKGVIRWKSSFPLDLEDMEKQIELLLKEAEDRE